MGSRDPTFDSKEQGEESEHHVGLPTDITARKLPFAPMLRRACRLIAMFKKAVVLHCGA